MALTILGPGAFPAGTILQTQKTVVTTPFFVSLGSDQDTTVTGLTVNITPNFSNSIILLTVNILESLVTLIILFLLFLEIQLN